MNLSGLGCSLPGMGTLLNCIGDLNALPPVRQEQREAALFGMYQIARYARIRNPRTGLFFRQRQVDCLPLACCQRFTYKRGKLIRERPMEKLAQSEDYFPNRELPKYGQMQTAHQLGIAPQRHAFADRPRSAAEMAAVVHRPWRPGWPIRFGL